jgi:hypothetical protein
LELQTRRLLEFVKKKDEHREIEELLADAMEQRLKAMSTTHFGLSAPVMNVTRLKAGAKVALASVRAASRALDLAADAALKKARRRDREPAAEFSLVDYARGVSTSAVTYHPKPSRALVRVRLATQGTMAAAGLIGPDGIGRAVALRPLREKENAADSELLFIEEMDGAERKDFQVSFGGTSPLHFPVKIPVSITENKLQNEFLLIEFDRGLIPVKFYFHDIEFSDGPFLRSAVTYGSQTVEAGAWRMLESAVLANGLIAAERASAELALQQVGGRVVIERELLLAAGLPYLYVHIRVKYPYTESDNFSKRKAHKLQTRYDNNWREVIPCELRPALFNRSKKPLRIWKHNYCAHVSGYDLDYAEFSRNAVLDSFNNHITNGWVAVSDGERGLLVAQSADVNSCFAFCPMRLRSEAGKTRILLNPFGSYYGNQL